MSETAGQKYNRIAYAIQQAILNEFPNPERCHCPGTQKLTELAARAIVVEDDVWVHITHCSHCYREFLDRKNDIRAAARKESVPGRPVK